MRYPRSRPALARSPRARPFATNPLVALLAVAGLLAAAPGVGAQSTEAATAAGLDAPNVVEVSAEDYAFRVPTELPSGWTTLRFTNEGEEHHFMYLARLPDERTFDEYVTQVMVPFDEGWRAIRDGEVGPDEGVGRIMEALPEWFGEIEPSGGPGLVMPGGTAEATMYLSPGEYIIECYMKTDEGEFHAIEGMSDPITVTAGGPEGAPPTADVRLTLASSGLQVDGTPRAGRQTFEVHYADHPEGTFGHDVELARLDEDGTVDEIVTWLNWIDIPGLMEPAPATFHGGINQMAVGSTAYFTADLEPGRYLFVSEYTGAMGVLQEFTVER